MKKQIIRKLTILALALTMLLSLAACGNGSAQNTAEQGDLLARIRARGSITVATEGDWSPWTYHDESDTLTGFDVELAALIAEGLGVTVEYQETDWDSILAGVDTGRFDIACNGVDYTDERAGKYNFSTPYLYMQEVLVVRADNEDIHGIGDLAGRTTTNSPNSTYAQIAEEAGAEVLYVNTLLETIQALEQGRADATINARVSIEDYLREHPDAPIKIVYESEGTSVCIPARKDADTESLMAAIDEILEGLRQDGRLGALSEKYFGADLTKRA